MLRFGGDINQNQSMVYFKNLFYLPINWPVNWITECHSLKLNYRHCVKCTDLIELSQIMGV